MAGEKQKSGQASCVDPGVSPFERSASFSKHPQTRKIIGYLTTCIPDALSYDTTTSYIKQKHKINDGILKKVNLEALHLYLTSLPIFL
jgi:hypothetical protein